MKKKFIVVTLILFGVVVLALASSYALFSINVTKNSNFKLAIGTLELSITDTTTEDKFIMESTVPTKDEVALAGDGYTFTLENTGTINSYYTIYLDDILLTDSGDRLDNSYVKLNIFNHTTNKGTTSRLTDYSDDERIVATGFLEKGASVTYTLRMWVDYKVGNEAQNKYFATQIRVVGQQQNALGYQEDILNGATPVLTDNLVPVEIANNGTVTRANIQEEWYSYEDKRWANAVVLKTNKTYKNNEVIPEDNIESYFVWIPKYSYKLWDLGKYDSLTTIDSTKPHAIPIKFGITNTDDRNIGECTTPMNEAGTQGLSGESGNCKLGDYMTHPAFLAFDSNGFWVGKFETGYDGATSTEEAQVNSNASNKIIIKPNVYSWRKATLGNMFKASYDYLRNDESHMMKNTEWGAVVYLSHSIYGTCSITSCNEVRVNNNIANITGYSALEAPNVGYNGGTSIEGNRIEQTVLGIDGTYTINYFNTNSVVASTTGNYSGIYDMSGNAYEYLAGYTTSAITVGGSSDITSIYSDFFTNSDWDKYYDKYSFNVDMNYDANYNYRILGDATGEIGPFSKASNGRPTSSWYSDDAYFLTSEQAWFSRGAESMNGINGGIFAIGINNGIFKNYEWGDYAFRIVLAPTK